MSIELKVRGEAFKLGTGQHKIACPTCSHSRKKKNKTLSLKVETEMAVYQCWHCNSEGYVFLKDQVRENVRPMIVAKQINETNLSDGAVSWLKSRGISEETATKAGLKSVNHWIQSIGSETECITFPYKNNGHVYASKIRSISDKGFSCNGSPQSFFNLENVELNDWIIICEGEMDALAFMETGYDSVVSVPNGAVMKVVDKKIDPSDDNKFKFLWDAKKQLDNADRIVIATDSDEAGQAMAEEIARRIGKDVCWKVEFPEDCKDANDVLIKYGRDGIDKIVTGCKPWPVAGLYDASHFYEQVDEIYEKGMGKGESTGYDNVDNYYTIVGGQITIVTGHPSSGKSEFVDQIMVNMAERTSWKFGICSFENEPRLHIAKLISKWLGKPFFDGNVQRLTRRELEAGKKFVQSHFSFLYQADGSLSSIDSIIERLKIAVLRHGIRGAVIDPYNYIQRPSDKNETEWISEILTRIRVFAQAHDIHIWFVAHPAKMLRGQDGKVPVPKGYDISGSAAWFAKADVGMSVHRPDPVNSVSSEIHIWKCRFSWVGKQGFTELDFNTITSSYQQKNADPFLNPVKIDQDNFEEIDIEELDIELPF